MNPGSVIVDVSSNSAYQLPSFFIPKKKYPLAETDENKFVATLLKKTNIVKDPYMKNGMAYSFSKNFVCWYAQKSAFDLGAKTPAGEYLGSFIKTALSSPAHLIEYGGFETITSNGSSSQC